MIVITGVVNLVIKTVRMVTGLNLGTPSNPAAFTFPNTQYASGTSAAQIEENWHGSLTIVGTNVTTIDLSDTNGAGLTLDGAAVAFTKAKGFWVFNRSTNAADIVTATFNGTNGWTNWVNGTMKVNPNSACGFADAGTTGISVTAGTGDKVSFANAATNTVTLDLIIFGNKS